MGGGIYLEAAKQCNTERHQQLIGIKKFCMAVHTLGELRKIHHLHAQQNKQTGFQFYIKKLQKFTVRWVIPNDIFKSALIGAFPIISIYFFINWYYSYSCWHLLNTPCTTSSYWCKVRQTSEMILPFLMYVIKSHLKITEAWCLFFLSHLYQYSELVCMRPSCGALAQNYVRSTPDEHFNYNTRCI